MLGLKLITFVRVPFFLPVFSAAHQARPQVVPLHVAADMKEMRVKQ